jgi:hypothetical protein
MTTISVAQQRVFWALLHEAGRYGPRQDDRELVLMAPWISDIPMTESGWSPLTLESIYPNSNGNLESLASTLIELKKLEFDVTVISLSTEGKWLTRDHNRFADAERDFFHLLKPHGISCSVVDDLHVKMLRTPYAVMSGSANFTRNGLFGRTRETVQVEHASNQQGFAQLHQIMKDFKAGSRDYFTRAPSIMDIARRRPNLESGLTGNASIELDEDQSNGQESPSVEEGDYPKMVPTDYLPPGTHLDSKQASAVPSLHARMSLLWSEVVEYTHGLVVDEHSEDMNTESLNQMLKGTNVSEICTRIVGFFHNEPEGTQARVKQRLSIYEDQPWNGFTGNLQRIIQGIPKVFKHLETGQFDVRTLGLRVDQLIASFRTLADLSGSREAGSI